MKRRIAVEAADAWYVETWDYSFYPPKIVNQDGPYELRHLPQYDYFAEDLNEDYIMEVAG